MMNVTDKYKLIYLIFAITFMIGAIAFLVVLVIAYIHNYESMQTTDIFGCITLFLFDFTIFYCSASCFIKYGMCRGIDFALDKQNNKAM